jgi:hypothetical protein
MRYDGDPIWTHDEACSPEQLCARCEAEDEARRLDAEEQELWRVAFETQAAADEAAREAA